MIKWLTLGSRVLIIVNTRNQGETLSDTIIEDITEKYNLQLQKDEFISIASHELKTPITSLQATLQMISRWPVPDNDHRPTAAVDLQRCTTYP